MVQLPTNPPMASGGPITRRALACGGAGLAFTPALARAEATGFTVYKTPTCACCSAWIEHMARAGYRAEVVEMPDLTPVRQRLKVPADLAACHTAVLRGYVLEGHVPADDVTAFLRRPPAGALGLVVPGMPIGSPGMEAESGRREAHFTLLLLGGGRRRIFARHG